jgi:hypothetical protein
MIEEALYKEILDNGLLLDHYFLLCNIKNGQKLVASRRMDGFINLMRKKGYMDGDSLTEKGIDLVQNCEFAEVIVPATGKVDIGTWAAGVHKKCQDKIKELTGKVQVKAKFTGEKKEYSFLCNATDLARVLTKVITLYKQKDYEKIEKALLRHIDKCHVSNHWFPLMQNYILKSGSSQMITELDDEGGPAGTKSNQKFV